MCDGHKFLMTPNGAAPPYNFVSWRARILAISTALVARAARTSFLLLSLMLLLVISLSTCTSEPLPPECRDFFSIPTSEGREKAFADFDLDKQLRIHRCGM